MGAARTIPASSARALHVTCPQVAVIFLAERLPDVWVRYNASAQHFELSMNRPGTSHHICDPGAATA